MNTTSIASPTYNTSSLLSIKFILIGVCLFFFLLNFTDFTILESIAVSLTLYYYCIYIDNLGKCINILDQIMSTFSLQLLLMPVVSYWYRPEDMAVDSDQYFSYMIPAIIALSFGFNTVNSKNKNHNYHIIRVKEYLSDKYKVVLSLLITGLIATFLYSNVSVELKQIITLFTNCLYTSVLYNYYSSTKKPFWILIVVFFLLIFQSISEGMFGQFFSWGIVWLPFFLHGRSIANKFILKFIIIISMFTMIPFIQFVKSQYRIATWTESVQDKKGDSKLFFELFLNQANSSELFNDSDILYASFNRLNQGTLTAKAIYYVPHQEPYANGEVVLHFFYPFIPRIFWSGKPVTGGYQNVKRFTGIDNGNIHSSNISPVGEGYVNFGYTGGIIFMLFYGLLFGYVYKQIFYLSLKIPTLFLWIPCLFTAGTASDTDVLTIWGTCATGLVFVYFIYSLFKRIGVDI